MTKSAPFGCFEFCSTVALAVSIAACTAITGSDFETVSTVNSIPGAVAENEGNPLRSYVVVAYFNGQPFEPTLTEYQPNLVGLLDVYSPSGDGETTGNASYALLHPCFMRFYLANADGRTMYRGLSTTLQTECCPPC